MGLSVLEEVSAIVVIFAAVLFWPREVTGTVTAVDFGSSVPASQRVDNTTHHAEKIHEFPQSNLYSCLELCAGTKGCTVLNYERNSTACAVYAITGTVQFEAEAGNWVFVKIADVTLPSFVPLCDPNNCSDGMYCRTFTGGPICLDYRQ